jgi:hypothetical protein
MADLGRILIVLGVALLVVGLALTFLPGLRLGRLPGDIVIRRQNWSVYIPIVTSLLLSLVLTLLLLLVSWFRR